VSREFRRRLDSSARLSDTEIRDYLGELLRRTEELASDLNDVDAWRRPHGDGSSDLRISRWHRGTRERRRR
jgi:hypothetical protein